MKQALLKSLKIILLIAAAVLVILLVFGLVLIIDWPWWVGIFLLMILAGIIVGIMLLRKILLRRREQRFVQQVIEQDETFLGTVHGKQKDELKEIQVKWKEAVDALRRSHLRKYGNPLYVLPWYLVIGESGSGKTTAIKSAKLSSPFVKVNQVSGISGTRNCDWWFFEQAIIIDTAGRYAVPIDQDRDKEEWQRFMNFLLKYRKKEPLNGLIVTIAANKLLESSPEEIEEDGRNIRRRIDELMRVLGSKFPVYVLTTKCDLIKGMAQFCDHLPEASLDQPMGFVNQDMTADTVSFQDQAFNAIGERLRNLRLLLLHAMRSREVDAGLLLFPEEFENLRKGMSSFLSGAFQQNPYQETPMLRGLFFSSGRQEGSPFSFFLNALGLIGEKEVLPGTSKGLFLHNFFSRILPRDRGLLAPTKRALEWRALTRNLGLVSWILLGVAMCGLLSFSFVNNLRSLRVVSGEFARPPVFTGNYPEDIAAIDRFQNAILTIERQNQNWWVPRFGLRNSMNVEMELKKKFCMQFQQRILTVYDKDMGQSVARMTTSVRDDVFAGFVSHYVRRINILEARLEGAELDELQSRPQPSYVALRSYDTQTTGDETKDIFGPLYLHYVLWRSDEGDIRREMDFLQSWLKHLIALKGTSPDWFMTWTNTREALPPVTLKDFWGGTDQHSSAEFEVHPACTGNGKRFIDGFFSEIESALPDPLFFQKQKTAYARQYREKCLGEWEAFAGAFSKGKERLTKREDWYRVASGAASDQGPYYTVLGKMAADLELITEGESYPVWVQQLYEFQEVKKQSSLYAGSMGTIAEGGNKVVASIAEKLGRPAEKKDVGIAAAKAYLGYHDALEAIKQSLDSGDRIREMVAQVFNNEPGSSPSPFLDALHASARMRSAMSGGRPIDQTVWNLIIGPYEFLWELGRIETACYLQEEWENKVLSMAAGGDEQPDSRRLLVQDGPVWQFVREGPAAHFIDWKPGMGYVAKQSPAGDVPFHSSFFAYLNKGAKGASAPEQSYNVSIKGLPTDTNREATVKPHRTRLELRCSDGLQEMVNYNFPVSKAFLWDPEKCSDVRLEIDVADIRLVKQYAGYHAFPMFLRDFQTGERIFFTNEFPNEREALKRARIKYIRVNYEFNLKRTTLRKILEQYSSSPGSVPTKIASCWES